MSLEGVIKQSGPTLKGVKAGNLFVLDCNNIVEANRSFSYMNRKLKKKNIRIIPVRYFDGKVLIYIYRSELLEKELSHYKAKYILESLGYSYGNCHYMVAQVLKKIRECDDFPHEIGLFLSYPPDDVECFMRREPCMDCKKCLWRAYSNKEEAVARSLKYKMCMEMCHDEFCRGVSIECLAN